ncbi:hypothetical protein RRG08_036683 [Elysia crispata]|uniref:Uncharacterized protein n=1 Tax=Elysia crispata TaxID=231223 RepID=A0AAE1AEV8_9GAST|nr:hypothetical protein RRG08_036683 [Elysia crispata]
MQVLIRIVTTALALAASARSTAQTTARSHIQLSTQQKSSTTPGGSGGIIQVESRPPSTSDDSWFKNPVNIVVFLWTDNHRVNYRAGFVGRLKLYSYYSQGTDTFTQRGAVTFNYPLMGCYAPNLDVGMRALSDLISEGVTC